MKRVLLVVSLLSGVAATSAHAAPPTLDGQRFHASDFGDDQQMSVLAVGSY